MKRISSISVILVVLFLAGRAKAVELSAISACTSDEECIVTTEFACPLDCVMAINKNADLSKLRAYVAEARKNIVCESCIKEKAIAVCQDGSCVKKTDSAYAQNPYYCESNADCAIREGACGSVVMNIYYDNSKSLAMRPYIECAAPTPISNPRCVQGLCVADEVASDGSQGDQGPAVACPMDARACPDGSYVGRVGPDCAFAPCP